MEDLLEKIRKIEALIAGAQTDGEKSAAILARGRLHNRIAIENKIQQKEFTLYTHDNWHKKLLLAICRKHGIQPYRYKRQKYTTVMVCIDEVFLNNVLWKEFTEYSNHLEKLVEDVTDSIIRKIHEDEDESIIQGNIG